MIFSDKLNTPGEHAYSLQGPVGLLEVVLVVPPQADFRYVAVLGHPHSLQGGTMQNKVVTTLVRVFKELNMPSIRFNFRGVGASGGVYDAGVGESEDMLFLARLWQACVPDARFIFAGFSFGSYVSYRAAAQCPHALLMTIAPAIHHYDYTEFATAPTPWIMVHGTNDEVVPFALATDFAAARPFIEFLPFEDTSHFFHGKLIALKEQLTAAIVRQLKLEPLS